MNWNRFPKIRASERNRPGGRLVLSENLGADIKALRRDSERQQEAQHEADNTHDQADGRRVTSGRGRNVVQESHATSPENHRGKIVRSA